MTANADITIYNREYDPKTRLDVWHRTVIENVWFKADNKVQQTDSGLKSSDAYKIRIPEGSPDKEYLDKEAYVKAKDKDGYWTLQMDDIIVEGKCTLEIEKPADLTATHKRYLKITSWSDNRFGGLSHWRVGGV